MHGARLAPPGQDRGDREVARRQPQRRQLGEDLDPARAAARSPPRPRAARPAARSRRGRRVPPGKDTWPGCERIVWLRSVSSRSGPSGSLAEEHQHGADPGLLVLRRHEPGQVVDGDRAGGLLDRPQPVGQVGPIVGRSQVNPEVLADQVGELLGGVEAAGLLVGDRCRPRRRRTWSAARRILRELVGALQVAARVGQRAGRSPRAAQRPPARCRGTGPGSRRRAPAPGRRTARGRPAGPASPPCRARSRRTRS